MQSSFLSRNVLYISGAVVERQRWVMTNDGSISPFSICSSSGSV